MKYKVNGAGDLFRKNETDKIHQVFYRECWLKGLLPEIWDLPVLKEMRQKKDFLKAFWGL